MGKQRKTWTTDEKEAIVLSVLRGALSAAEAARQHGVNESLVHTWKAQFLEAGRARLAGEKVDHGQSALERENDRLKRILAEKELELDRNAKSQAALSLDELFELHQSHPHLSLRCFARYVGVPYHRLRDHRRAAPVRAERRQHLGVVHEAVRRVALSQPTSGYRLLYQELRAQGEAVGLHRVRTALKVLGLNPPQPRKNKKGIPVEAEQDWPSGRRVHIDATRLSLPDGVCWVYHVLDVESRVVLSSQAVRGLSQHLAKLTLDEGVSVRAPSLCRATRAVISRRRSSNRAVRGTARGCAARSAR